MARVGLSWLRWKNGGKLGPGWAKIWAWSISSQLDPTRANSSQVGGQTIPNSIKVVNLARVGLSWEFGQGFRDSTQYNYVHDPWADNLKKGTGARISDLHWSDTWLFPTIFHSFRNLGTITAHAQTNASTNLFAQDDPIIPIIMTNYYCIGRWLPTGYGFCGLRNKQWTNKQANRQTTHGLFPDGSWHRSSGWLQTPWNTTYDPTVQNAIIPLKSLVAQVLPRCIARVIAQGWGQWNQAYHKNSINPPPPQKKKKKNATIFEIAPLPSLPRNTKVVARVALDLGFRTRLMRFKNYRKSSLISRPETEVERDTYHDTAHVAVYFWAVNELYKCGYYTERTFARAEQIHSGCEERGNISRWENTRSISALH